MALSIKTAEADELARSLARLTGESMTEAVTTALRERLARERARRETAATSPGPDDILVPPIACRIRHAVSQPRGVGRGGRRGGVIVVDSSAVVAILFGEPAAEALLARLAMDSDRVMSSPPTSKPALCWPDGGIWIGCVPSTTWTGSSMRLRLP